MSTPTVVESSSFGVMRFFTPEWLSKCNELDPNFNPQIASDEYSNYFSEVSSKLPDDIHELESECSLHDACLESMEVNLKDGIVSLQFDRIRFGEEAAEKSVSLTYTGVTRVRSSSNLDRSFVNSNGFGDLAYYEFHLVSEGTFQHACLFASGIELGVEFKNFEFVIIE